MKVTDILRNKGADVATIGQSATLAEAAQVLSVRKIGALVVSDDGTTIAGIISERDIVHQLAEQGAAALDSAVGAAMTADVHTCGCDDHIEELMRRMTEHRIRHLPVVEDGALVGVVSIGDVVKRRVGELESVTDQLTDYIQTGR
jgi:CBS domain-containing protein